MRIVSLAPSVTSTLFALGAQRHLVGVTRWCKDVAGVKGLPLVGDCWRGDAGQVAKLKPDIVIGSVPYQAETVKALLDQNLTLLAKTPRSLADVFSDILLIGRLVGKEKRAGAVVRQMQAKIQNIASRVRHIRKTKRRPRVYCESWPKPVIVSPPWVKELTEIAGGRFVPGGPAGRKTTDREIVQANPEVVILAWAAMGMRPKPAHVLRRKGWKDLAAVQDGRVCVISDELLNTPAPILMRGLELLAHVIHPKIFARPRDSTLQMRYLPHKKGRS